MTVLSVRAKARKGAFALDADFDAPLDGVTAIFGPSGAGKSLLLHVIAGLARADTATITLNGRQLDSPETRVPAHERGVGLVFQDARLFPHLTVRGNLDYAARRAPRTLMSLDAACALLDIGALLDRPVRNLSGGEANRVALARALLSAPDLLLLDEPFAALDSIRRHAFLDLLSHIHHDHALPMLMVSHHIDDAARICKTIIAMTHGSVLCAGSLSTLAPSERFQSLLSARDCGAAVPFTRLHAGDGQNRGAAWLRADAVLLASVAPTGLSARNVWEGRVREIRDEPHARLVVVETGAGTILSRVTEAAARELGLHHGARVWAIIKTHAYDTAEPEP